MEGRTADACLQLNTFEAVEGGQYGARDRYGGRDIENQALKHGLCMRDSGTQVDNRIPAETPVLRGNVIQEGVFAVVEPKCDTLDRSRLLQNASDVAAKKARFAFDPDELQQLGEKVAKPRRQAEQCRC